MSLYWRPDYAPTCTDAVLRLLVADKPLGACELHACLGDTLNREGRPVQLLSVQKALRHLCMMGHVRKVGRKYVRTAPAALTPEKRVSKCPTDVEHCGDCYRRDCENYGCYGG